MCVCVCVCLTERLHPTNCHLVLDNNVTFSKERSTLNTLTPTTGKVDLRPKNAFHTLLSANWASWATVSFLKHETVWYATNNLTNVSRKIPRYPLGPAPNKNIIAIVYKVFNSFLMDISTLGRHCVLGESFRKHWLIVWAWLRTYSLGKKGSLFRNRNREYYPQKDTELFLWFNCYSEYWFSE